MYPRLSLRLYAAPWRDAFECYLIQELRPGHRAVGRPNIELVTLPEEPALIAQPEPTFTLPSEAVQQLMDELWRAGVRPSDQQESAGELAATRAHLADARDLARWLLPRAVKQSGGFASDTATS